MNSTIYSLSDSPFVGPFYFKYNKTLIRVPGFLNPIAKECTNQFWIWFTDIKNPGIHYLEFKYEDLDYYESYVADPSSMNCLTSKIDLDKWFETESKK